MVGLVLFELPILHTGKNEHHHMSKPASKKSTVAAADKAATLEKAGKVDLKSVRTTLAQAKTKIASQLSEIEEDLVAKGADLENIEGAIEIKTEQLQALHDKDDVLLEIDELKLKRDAFKAASDTEKKRIEDEDKQLREDAAKARKREADEHERTTKLARQTDKDNWEYEKGKREREMREKEVAIQAKQGQYDTAIARFENLDEEINIAANEKARAQVEAITRNHKHAVEITKAATDAEIAGLKKDIQHRDDTIKAQQVELSSLRVQLAQAQAAQTDLAKATVDNAKTKEAHADAMSTFLNVNGGGNGKTARG